MSNHNIDFERMFKIDELDTFGDRWGHKWRGSQKFRLDLLFKRAKRYLIDQTTFLDCGCGQPLLINKVKKYNRRINCFGCDISHNIIKWNKYNNRQAVFKLTGLPELDYKDNSFDIISCADVIYYLSKKNQKKYLLNISKKLKDQGIILLSGAVNQGEKYLDEKSIINLMEEHFIIKNVYFDYGMIYNLIEKLPLQFINIERRLKDILFYNSEDFLQWSSNKNLAIVSIVSTIKRFFIFKKGFILIISFISLLIRQLLKPKIIPVFFHRLSKMLKFNSFRTRITIIGTTKN